MNLPEWTAQALVASGAVFLLVSAYVMGVMVPNGLLAPNDFDADFYFEGDIQTFDLDPENGTGVFIDNVGSGSYDPTKAKFEGGATLNVVGTPDGEDYTILTQNFSLTSNGIDGEGTWLGTISDTSDNPSSLDRKNYEVDGKQGTWTPTNLPETGKTYEFPNPVNSAYTDNFTCADKRTLDDVEVMTCTAQAAENERMVFVPGAGSDLELLQSTFESYNSLGEPGAASMWFSYISEQIVGTELGGVIDRVYNVTVYMEVPTLLYLENNFNFTTYYKGEIGNLNTATLQVKYYDATGLRAGCVIKDNSTESHINVLGYLRTFEVKYDNGTALDVDYGTQSSEGCWDSSSSDDFTQELVNVTYDVNRRTLQYVNGTTATEEGGDGFNFFSPICETISVISKDCWVPAANATWPNAMYGLHMQNYTFIEETEVNGNLAYHFRANETDINGNSGSLYHPLLGNLDMDFYEDVWIDPVTGTILNQKYDIQIKIPPIVFGLGGATLRDIVANYTQESIDEASSSAKRQALAQYYQGHEVAVLTLNGAYTEKTVNGQIESEQDKVSGYKLGTKTLPSILIGTSILSLAAGFYVYYQNGGAMNSVGSDLDSSSESTESIAEDDVSDEGSVTAIPKDDTSSEED
jgi:hypothetical protein|tara:strand:- start:1053 stop:2957 length:1905 start_codon:yes stop_codon:yes gene_type:complete